MKDRRENKANVANGDHNKDHNGIGIIGMSNDGFAFSIYMQLLPYVVNYNTVKGL